MTYAKSSLYNTLFGDSGSSKQSGGGKPSIFKANLSGLFKLITDKKEFFIMVFANLIAQLGITYYVMEKVNLDVNDTETNKQNQLISTICIVAFPT